MVTWHYIAVCSQGAPDSPLFVLSNSHGTQHPTSLARSAAPIADVHSLKNHPFVGRSVARHVVKTTHLGHVRHPLVVVLGVCGHWACPLLLAKVEAHHIQVHVYSFVTQSVRRHSIQARGCFLSHSCKKTCLGKENSNQFSSYKVNAYSIYSLSKIS